VCRSWRPGACQACSANSRRCWDPSGWPPWPTRPGSTFTPPLDPETCRVAIRLAGAHPSANGRCLPWSARAQQRDRRAVDAQFGHRTGPCQPRHGQARRPRPRAAGWSWPTNRAGQPRPAAQLTTARRWSRRPNAVVDFPAAACSLRRTAVGLSMDNGLVRWAGEARAAADDGVWHADGESGDRSAG
jgi:hypothetical protein